MSETLYPPEQFFDDTGISDYKVFTGDVQERTVILDKLTIDGSREPLETLERLAGALEALIKHVKQHMDMGERPCPLCNHHFVHEDDCPFEQARAALGKNHD